MLIMIFLNKGNNRMFLVSFTLLQLAIVLVYKALFVCENSVIL